MPLYNYWCYRCCDRFDWVTNNRDKDEVHCPKCNSLGERLLTKPAPPKVNGYSAENGYSDNKGSLPTTECD